MKKAPVNSQVTGNKLIDDDKKMEVGCVGGISSKSDHLTLFAPEQQQPEWKQITLGQSLSRSGALVVGIGPRDPGSNPD